MRLIDELEERAKRETSLFRARLREDIVRLRKLEEITRRVPDAEECRRSARRLRWTALDSRTHESVGALDRAADAVLRIQQPIEAGLTDGDIEDAWHELGHQRM